MKGNERVYKKEADLFCVSKKFKLCTQYIYPTRNVLSKDFFPKYS